MSQNNENAKKLFSGLNREVGRSDSGLLIRLVIAAVIFAVALIVNLTAPVRIALLVLSALVAGYDIALDAVNSVEAKDFFATSLVVIFVAVIAFVIGYGAEAAVMVILYQIGKLLAAYVEERTRKSAMELLRYQDEEVVNRIQARIQEKENCTMQLEKTIGHSAGLILKLAMLLALILAIVLPFTGLTFQASIHRALMILIVCTPFSIVAAMPLTAIVGLCFSAQQGVQFNDARALENAMLASTAVFDKAGIFTEDAPRLLSIQSDTLDEATFMSFAAHAVYYSTQPLAKAISDAYTMDYRLDVISDFSDIPGCGVELKIAGNPVILATAELLAGMGIRVPEGEESGQAYHMVIAGRYVGKLVISSNLNDDTRELAVNMRDAGVKRCILLTEDSAEASQKLAESLQFNEVYGECDTEKKLKLIGDMSQSASKLMYVYSNGIESHSAAALDVRVSKKAKYADAVVQPDQVNSLPLAVEIAHRTREIAVENALFAFVIKAILIFLSVIGLCNLWFAIFIDIVAALFTMLNSIRVTTPSLFRSFRSENEE